MGWGLGKAWCGAGGEEAGDASYLFQRGGREQAPVVVRGRCHDLPVVAYAYARGRAGDPPKRDPAAAGSAPATSASPCCIASLVGLKMDGNIPVPIRSIFFIFVCPFSYLWDPVFVFTEVEMRFLRPFPRNPVFTWN